MTLGRSPGTVTLLALLALPLGGCARYARYRAAPLAAPTAERARWEERRLDDPELARFLAAANAPAVDSGWDPRGLALAALYFRAELAESRGRLAAARAGELTAGARPDPTAEASVDRAARVDEGKTTPWSFSLTAGLTLETGGKRSARIARARAAALAARLRLQQTAWDVAQDARAAALAAVGADAEVAGWRAEARTLDQIARLLRARYGEGQLSLAEVARADADAQGARLQLVDAERARAESRAGLARALGVSAGTVDSLALRTGDADGCRAAASLGADSLRALALRTRADVGAALADYAAADAALRLEIARQYPDITIGPGIAWDQGVRRWVLSLATPGIPLHQRGPIAEAAAERAAGAAHATVVEDAALAAVDSGLAACRGVRAQRSAADSLVTVTARADSLARAAYDRGEVGATEVAFADLALLRARRARAAAATRGAAAGAALERAVATWLSAPAIRWPDPTVSPSTRNGDTR